jgi:hypothetical protein
VACRGSIRSWGDENWLRLRSVERRISVGDIADELPCDGSTVIAALAAVGIPGPRPTRGRPRRFAELGDHEWLRRRYLDEEASQQELAVEIGCSIPAVRKALAEAQVTVTPRAQGRRSSAQDMGRGSRPHRCGNRQIGFERAWQPGLMGKGDGDGASGEWP